MVIQKNQNIYYIWPSILLFLSSQPLSFTLSIQAMINLDNDSEDLIGLLIDKVDSIIDPKVADSQNATHELAYALLNIGPIISVNGTISDGPKGFRVNFSCNVKAVSASPRMSEMDLCNYSKPDESGRDAEMNLKRVGGILEPIVTCLDPLLQYLILIIFNGILTNVVTNIMIEAALLSNVNLI